MRYYDVYGSRTTNIDDLQRAVSAALEIPFKPRDSLVKGEYYKADLARPCSIEVRPNLVNDYGEENLVEPDFAEHAVLLFVDGFEIGPELEQALTRIPGLELLRRKTLPD